MNFLGNVFFAFLCTYFNENYNSSKKDKKKYSDFKSFKNSAIEYTKMLNDILNEQLKIILIEELESTTNEILDYLVKKSKPQKNNKYRKARI